MTQRFTVYVTYLLQNTTSSGYVDAIHCNYINKYSFNDIANQDVSIFFTNQDDFKYMSTSRDVGTGFMVNKICMIIQIVSNSLISTNPDVYVENKPQSHLWRCFDVTNQIIGHIIGEPLTPIDMTRGVFKLSLNEFNTSGISYNLNYLNYPQNTDITSLSFGDEEVFLGNVESEIEASVYTTDLSINLPLNEFNTSTNPTWDGESINNSILISEIGIYNDERKLIGIGKFNNPLIKNNQISRTIVFDVDF